MKRLSVLMLGLVLNAGAEPNFKTIAQQSSMHRWTVVMYHEFYNRTYYVRNGRVDVVYPRTNVAKELGLPWSRDLDHSAYPTLSPDGNYVAYVRRRSAAKRDEAISIFDARENTSRDLVNCDKEISELLWSPNGKEIAFFAYPDLFTLRLYSIDIETRIISELNEGRPTISMSWSPDGQKFIVSEYPRSPDSETFGGGLFIVDLKTKERRSIGQGAWPSWSPNGDLIAYFGADNQNCYTMTSDGLNKRKLFSYRPLFSTGYRLMGPLVWSPDGRYIIYHREDGPKGDQRVIYLYDIKDRSRSQIFSGGPVEIVGCVSSASK